MILGITTNNHSHIYTQTKRMSPKNSYENNYLKKKTNILHVFGNPVSEFTKNMGIMHQKNHEKAGYEIEGLDLEHHYALVHPGRLWSFPLDLTDISLEDAPKMNIIKAIQIIGNLEIDVGLVHVHTTMCNFKTLFELLEIPLVGTGGEQSANVADKATSRALLLQAGVKVPR